jgi:mRNA-degrading endonuclease YafQ of YafQ-DinJ toxin-antitoxin module
MDKEDHKVGEDLLEFRECLVQKDLKVMWVLMDRMVHLDLPDLMDLLVTVDLLVFLDQLDPSVD